MTHVPPLDPLSSLIENFQQRGGTIWAFPPCVTSRGYKKEDLLDGVASSVPAPCMPRPRKVLRRCGFDDTRLSRVGVWAASPAGVVRLFRPATGTEKYQAPILAFGNILVRLYRYTCDNAWCGQRGGFDDIREGQ